MRTQWSDTEKQAVGGLVVKLALLRRRARVLADELERFKDLCRALDSDTFPGQMKADKLGEVRSPRDIVEDLARAEECISETLKGLRAWGLEVKATLSDREAPE